PPASASVHSTVKPRSSGSSQKRTTSRQANSSSSTEPGFRIAKTKPTRRGRQSWSTAHLNAAAALKRRLNAWLDRSSVRGPIYFCRVVVALNLGMCGPSSIDGERMELTVLRLADFLQG